MRKQKESMYSIFRIKRFKRALKVILMICLCIIASIPYNIKAKAAGSNTKFIGDGVGTSIHNANSMGADVFYAKYLDRNNQDDNLYNRLNVTSDLMLIFSTGKITTNSGEAVNMKYTLSDSNGNIIWETDTTRKDKGNNVAYSYQIGLKKGVYYLNIKRCGGASFTGSNKGLLLYGCSVFDAPYFETEPNNSTYTSNPILTDIPYLGNIDTNNDDYFYFKSDNYKICISLRINDETTINKIKVYLKDINDNEKILNFTKNGEYYKCEVDNFNFNLSRIIIKPTDIIDNVLYELTVEENSYSHIQEPVKLNGWVTENGKQYWYKDGVKQGTEGRGKEIYDPSSNAWYWLDSIQGGAKTVNKDVYQESKADDAGNMGKWVRYDSNGHMIKGWNTNEKGTYYFDLTYGTMYKGYKTIDGVTYYFDVNTGITDRKPVPNSNQNGWVTIGGKQYWYENGVCQGTDGRGKEIYDPGSDAWYWLDAVQGGAKAVSKDVYQESKAGICADRPDGTGKWVRYDANGHMVKGWNTNSSGTYYFDQIYGTMYKGTQVIDGKSYRFDENTGILIN